MRKCKDILPGSRGGLSEGRFLNMENGERVADRSGRAKSMKEVATGNKITFCAQGQYRAADLPGFNRTLYHLSYLSMCSRYRN